jgi:ankyrin repeat protein
VKGKQDALDAGALMQELAVISLQQDKLDDAQTFCQAAMREPIRTEKNRARPLDASHILAQVNLRRGLLDQAKIDCMKAIKGRRRLSGTSQPYWESLSLMATICECQGDVLDAQGHASSLPEGSVTPEFKRPDQTLEEPARGPPATPVGSPFVQQYRSSSPLPRPLSGESSLIHHRVSSKSQSGYVDSVSSRSDSATGTNDGSPNPSVQSSKGHMTFATIVERLQQNAVAKDVGISMQADAMNRSSEYAIDVPASPTSLLEPTDVLAVVVATSSCKRLGRGDLDFVLNDTIDVTEYTSSEWWKGQNRRTGDVGKFQRSHVHIEGFIERSQETPAESATDNIPEDVLPATAAAIRRERSQRVPVVPADTDEATDDWLRAKPRAVVLDPASIDERRVRRKLLEHHIDVDHGRFDVRKVLVWAAEQGDLHCVALCLRGWEYTRTSKTLGYKTSNLQHIAPAHPNSSVGGTTALLQACEKGHEEIVCYLIQQGATTSCWKQCQYGGKYSHGPDCQDGYSPLACAIAGGHIMTVQILLQSGASANPKEYQHFTHKYSHPDVSPLHLCVQRGNVSLGSMLLQAGADTRKQGINGDTPLHVASRSSLEFVELLLSRDADIEARDNDEDTPLRIAVINGKLEICSALASHGADISTTSERKRTLMHAAAISGHKDIISWLVERGLRLDSFDVDGRIPLHLAADSVVDELLRLAPSTIEARDYEGATPLVVAAFGGRTQVCCKLLDHGADIHTMNDSGETATKAAQMFGRTVLVKILRTYVG